MQDMRSRAAVLAVAALLTTAAAPAAAKTYWAERFAASIRVLPGGAIEVTEVVVYRFEEGTFDHVFRELPRRRTDDIEIRYAEMDGRRMPFGSGSGEVEVSTGSPVRVRWRFAPRTGTSHTFTLNYVAKGVVYKDSRGDVLEWIALPTRHDYRIGSADIVVVAPATPAIAPAIESERVTDASVEPAGERVTVSANGISKNGWVKLRLAYPDAAVIASMPAWQQRQIAVASLAPRWMIAAGLIFGVGLVLMFALRQRYDVPPYGIESSSHSVDAPPDTLRPALAGAVASNGSVGLQQAMAALFTLADRGAITIEEEPRSWGQRHFTIHRNARLAADVAPEEAALLDIAFRKKELEDSVTLSKARSRVASGIGTFKKVVTNEMRALGLLDDQRVEVRSRYLHVSIALFILAGLLVVPAGVLTGQFDGWPFLVCGALAAVAIVGLIFYGSLTPLSNDGVRRSERWRAYQRYLRDVARDRAEVPRHSSSMLLPFAVALGLASAWSKFIKHHPQNVPAWFRALSADGSAFPAFVAAGGAADGGGGGSGGGAAGGGGAGAG
jgi:hypothetical protein